MHDQRSIILARVRRVLAERIRPAETTLVTPLDVAAWQVTEPDGIPGQGEPVAAQVALAADFTPTAVGMPWGPPWGTTWFRFRASVPAEFRDAPLEAIVDLGWSSGAVGGQAEGLVFDKAGRIVKGIHPRNAWVPVQVSDKGKVRFFVEAAANPEVLRARSFAPTLVGRKQTADPTPLYRLARADLVDVHPAVRELIADTVTLLATPLYSNTTLVALLPALALGATVVMMGKFDTLHYLELAQQYRVTHTILVPVQYQRLMDDPAFDHFDLSSFQAKFSTSAPFGASLMAEVLRRWPGKLTEIYGMTEGGGRCELEAHRHPDKLHTVGRPASGHDIRLIDESGHEVAPGETGEVVGSSSAMMRGYHRLPEKTREVEWFDTTGKRFIRTGDVGRFDEDGFLILSDRMKDMVISGGFNIYPSDIEAELAAHPEVRESAVIGVSSRRWGETPAAFVVLKPGAGVSAESLLAWVNGRLGKMQRLASLELVDALPRSEIGKVLKRELRAIHASSQRSPTS